MGGGASDRIRSKHSQNLFRALIELAENDEQSK